MVVKSGVQTLDTILNTMTGKVGKTAVATFHEFSKFK
jgi:hypothetical protein